jgi:hypothetical protein
MRWLLTGCLLGGFGALLKYWQSPFAIWASLTGVAVLAVGFLNWLNAYGSGAGRARSHGGDGWSSAGSDYDCSGSGDGCGGDGGGGGGD